MQTSIIALLQVVSALLLSLTQNPQASLAAKQQALAVAYQAVELSTQALATSTRSMVLTPESWPNYSRLLQSLYFNTAGTRVPLGSGVELIGEYLSFGDLDLDGLDDAMVVIRQVGSNGTASLALAAMVNHNPILSNVAVLSLGADQVTIYEHKIEAGVFKLDMAIPGQGRQVKYYKLVGNQIVTL